MDKKDPYNIVAWRKKIGLTQKSLAEYLQISRSHLSMIELGERKMQERILAEFNHFISFYPSTPPPALVPSPEERHDTIAMLNQQIQKATQKLEKLKKQMTLLQKEHQDARLVVQGLQANRLTEGNATEEKLIRQSMESLEAVALKKLSKNHSLTQIKLELEIVKLESIIQKAQEMIAEEQEAAEGKGQ